MNVITVVCKCCLACLLYKLKHMKWDLPRLTALSCNCTFYLFSSGGHVRCTRSSVSDLFLFKNERLSISTESALHS